ncbi:MAG TPA: aspartate 1-decarboxylase [candidate division Zixibacteria bacterium]|nr:aspartate 1-decarboxylase [candidate division Zixibacteria bacterium]MDD4916369.1 aspartate 1-decarboxylase [candidate division Zixibacteria bacterium]MDM7972829.1 aspartate 1-decarboxylase [candidate division Zixibacteria bacterium]HOD66605.1 aspartate 1-decarboxylase [candidate division Zixibacteria bacterium]HOZ09057.1 aspartate 1-decarboxylase [candidate division Zixibacteria bacterium]
MLITVCKSKIHRATITQCSLDYVGSMTIDEQLMKAADLVEYEKIQVANVTNGERFETYVIKGKPGSGTIALNGAAAHKGAVGDLVIIIAYGLIDHKDGSVHKPAVVHVDQNNKQIRP